MHRSEFVRAGHCTKGVVHHGFGRGWEQATRAIDSVELIVPTFVERVELVKVYVTVLFAAFWPSILRMGGVGIFEIQPITGVGWRRR